MMENFQLPIQRDFILSGDKIMAEKNDKKKTGFVKGFKNWWWLQLAFLFVFLIGGGFYAFINMNKEAHKLVGGDKYADMSASQMYNSRVSTTKRGFFLSRKKNLSDNGDSVGKGSPTLSASARLEKRKLSAASSEVAGAPGNDIDEDYETEDLIDEETSAARGHLSDGLRKRLAIKKDRVFSSKDGKGKTSGNFLAASKGDVSLKENEETTAKKGRAVATKKTSVMQSLKKTWKMGIYGARDASRDAAKNWIARAFDNVSPSRYSLEYSEDVKINLDRINPNSIPGYLRDMDMSKSSAKSLGINDVNSLSLDEDGTQEALDKDVKYQASKLANNASDGMLNSLFSGMNFGGGSPTNNDIGDYGDEGDEGDEGPTDRNLPEPVDPEDPPDLFGEEVMDFGGDCGEECGCTCEAACCCLPPDYFNNTGDFPEPDPNTTWV